MRILGKMTKEGLIELIYLARESLDDTKEKFMRLRDYIECYEDLDNHAEILKKAQIQLGEIVLNEKR